MRRFRQGALEVKLTEKGLIEGRQKVIRIGLEALEFRGPYDQIDCFTPVSDVGYWLGHDDIIVYFW